MCTRKECEEIALKDSNKHHLTTDGENHTLSHVTHVLRPALLTRFRSPRYNRAELVPQDTDGEDFNSSPARFITGSFHITSSFSLRQPAIKTERSALYLGQEPSSNGIDLLVQLVFHS